MKGKTASFAAGFTAAALLFGGGSALAATVFSATPSTQTFYLDGQKVELEPVAVWGASNCRPWGEHQISCGGSGQ